MPAEAAGLCGGCRHVQRVASARGSVFWLCRRARDDPRYPKYPRLPVLRCEGFEPADERADMQEEEGAP
jgi:hypothetical protein